MAELKRQKAHLESSLKEMTKSTSKLVKRR